MGEGRGMRTRKYRREADFFCKERKDKMKGWSVEGAMRAAKTEVKE